MSDRARFAYWKLREGNKNEEPRVVRTVVVILLIFQGVKDGHAITSKATAFAISLPRYDAPEKDHKNRLSSSVVAVPRRSRPTHDCDLDWFGDVEGRVREFGSTLRFLGDLLWYHLSDWYACCG